MSTARRVLGTLTSGAAKAEGKAKEGLVLAIGNAQMAENAPLLATYAKDQDVDVREAAARALRDVDTPAVRTTLLEMLDDGDDEVARAALGSYDKRPLGSDDLTALADRVAGGKVNGDMDVALLSIVQSHTGEREPAERILRQLLTRVHGNGEQEAKIRLLLRRTLGEGG